MVTFESILGQSESLFVLTNTTALSEADFWVIFLLGPRLLLVCPLYEPLLWFMINWILYAEGKF